MKRREFMTLLGGAAAWPIVARAQQPGAHNIGFLSSLSEAPSAGLVAAFRRGLQEAGFVEGDNVTVEYRWADGRYDRLAAMAAELVARRVDVLVSTGGGPTATAAKEASSTIPVVFITGTDPVRSGLVSNFSHPAGNLTGVYILTTELEPKRLGLLRELVPPSAALAALMNPNNTGFETQREDVHAAARVHSQPVRIFTAANESEIDAAFAEIGQYRPEALLVASDPYLSIRREQLVSLAARYRLPTMYQWREFALAGGLMSYGTSLADGYRQAGLYVGRVLKGANPANIPVVQSTKFELVINMRTAKALGITIPPGVLAIADEVIE